MRRGRWLEVCWYAVLSAVALAANLARGTQFYVAPGGSNSHAETAARAGDTGGGDLADVT